MKERKKIVIFANKLESGGVEVSLVNFINKIISDKKDIDITLVLIKRQGIYLDNLKEKCTIIEVPIEDEIYIEVLDKKINNIKYIKGIKNKSRFLYMKLLSRINKENYYKKILKKTKNLEEEYNLAIDFHSYGYFGTSYVVEKITAKNKILFIHDENIKFLKNVRQWIYDYDKYFCVSGSCAKILKSKYIKTAGKIEIFHNIINEKEIIEKSLEKIDQKVNCSEINLLTIGRLEHQKGYDLLVEIARKLKKENIKFIWYIIGTGSQKNKIERWIKKSNLENNVILLGMKKNPYPYLRACDIYVQPSRHEGYGIAIAEARCLKKAIVATKIECIEEQIINDRTGILCEFDSDKFCDSIKNLIYNKKYRNVLSTNLNENKFQIKNDIIKIYDLLD